MHAAENNMTRHRLAALTAILCLAGTALADTLKAGAFAMDVTPKSFPISVNGNMADVQAKAANDPLHARCLVLDDGKTRLAIAVVDSCMLPRDLVEDAKARANELTGIPADHILISATHTHSAPTVTGVFQSEPDPEYVKYLPGRIAEGIKDAHDRRVPARIGFGRARDETQVYNRRWKREHALIPPDPFGNTTDKVQMNPGHQAKGLVEPAGPIDPEICLVSVQTRDGKPLALLANYSLHYVGGNPPLSADYFGAFAERIKQLVAPDAKEFVGIMSNGTSGDANNINFGAPAVKYGPGERIKLVADSVAKKVADRYAKIEYRDEVTLVAAVKDLELGVRKPTEKDLERARRILEENKDKKVLAGTAAIYARESALLAKYPDAVPVKVSAFRFGDIGIVGIPCEVFAEIGLDIKKSSPLKDTFTIELANGYNGYLPTPAQHALGGYETWRARSSYLEVEASTKIVAAVKELLTGVAK
jgi:neutral ceramidase